MKEQEELIEIIQEIYDAGIACKTIDFSGYADDVRRILVTDEVLSDVVLLSSLDVGDKFWLADDIDQYDEDGYYEVKSKKGRYIQCLKPRMFIDSYHPSTAVKRL